MNIKTHKMAVDIINAMGMTGISSEKLAAVLDSILLEFGSEITISHCEIKALKSNDLNGYIEDRKRQAVYKIAEEIYKMKGYELKETNHPQLGRKISLRAWLAQ
jgi:hypothetical protein